MPSLWRQEAISARELAGAGPVPIGGEIHHNFASGAETIEISKPARAQYVVVRGEAGVHRIRAGRLNARTFTDGNVNVANNTITITAHGYTHGDGPLRLSNSGGALPAGLAINTDYWVVVIDADTIKLSTTPGRANRPSADALAVPPGFDPIVVDITAAAGGGTHSIGGNQGAGNPVGFAPTGAVPTADVAGFGSWPLLSNETVIFHGSALTVRALAANDVVSWYVVD